MQLESELQIKIDANLSATTITERATQHATLSHKDPEGLFFDHPRPASPRQSPGGGSGSACKISFSSTRALFLVQISVEAEGGEGGGNEHAPVVAHRTGHPEN